MKKYIPGDFESKWQKKWEENNFYKADESSSKPKKYILDMFPYPSGDSMHVGHFKGYIATDIVTRYYRFAGFNVLHPMGWDAFGLPAENYALKTGIPPAISTAKNIANIKRQMQMVSLSYDWDREINTTDPNYYKWTQWIFIKLFEKGLAYEDNAPINWCPSCKTGLANEEVLNGECERCNTPVEQKKIRQWMLKITDYADKLLEGLEDLNWPQAIKEMQTNWIGRSEGALIKFPVVIARNEVTKQSQNKEEIASPAPPARNDSDYLEVFTTRPDTIFGATFLVISPEYPGLMALTNAENREEVEKYIAEARKKSELERKIGLPGEALAKSGVFTGSYAKNPMTGEDIPIWVADYVLMGYGTGAIMAVPAHDQRDYDFAKKYDLEIRTVILGSKATPESDPGHGSTLLTTGARMTDAFASPASPDRNDKVGVYEGDGVLINSGEFNGLSNDRAKINITKYLEEHQFGKKQVQYHLRDWVFSRQRYWGEPIPLVHCNPPAGGCGIVAIPEKDLPLKLPEVEKYEPTGTGESPLAGIDEWVNTTCPKCGGPAKRETNTMPQWAGSCWYYLRFCDPKNDQELISKEADKYWMPVDWYVGGAEHAVLHLLYARFWHKFLFDEGVVTTKEPFQKLTNVGLVLASDGRKMSKRWENVITPDEIVKEYGADTLRVYEAFMGPFENTISWDPSSIFGVYRFLNRVWGLSVILGNKERVTPESNNEDSGRALLARMTNEDLRIMHKTIKKVGGDIETLKLNTAVASLMEWLNYLSRKEKVSREEYETFLILLAPFAPHMTEELWSHFAPEGASRDKEWSIHTQPWPEYDEKYLEEEEIIIVVQVNGKVRDNLVIQKDIVDNKKDIENLAIASSKVQKFVAGKKIVKNIYISGKIFNIVTDPN